VLPPQAAAVAAVVVWHAPFSPLHLFPLPPLLQDVTYDVVPSQSKTSIRLLRGVTGIARPGRLTALMGASGAGKTTLLDVLAGEQQQQQQQQQQ
jgi:ABC-type bacteriocin/lantibiotic exporter with double-glycine peptidase domain